MKILIVSQYWEPENGVPQRRWAWLTQRLRAEGHSVTVIAPFPHYLNEGPVARKQTLFKSLLEYVAMPLTVEKGAQGEKIYRSRFIPAGTSITSRVFNQVSVALGQLAVVALMRRREGADFFDVTISTVPALPTAAVGLLTARLLSTGYVIDLRDAWPDLLNYSKSWNDSTGKRSLREKVLTKGPAQLMVAASSWMLSQCLRLADGVIATSERLQTTLQRRIPKSEGRYATVRNVFPVESRVDWQPQTKPRDAARPLRVLYAGTLGRAQNLDNAVDAVELLHFEGIPVHLRLVGSGAAKDYLSQRARNSSAMIEVLDRKSSDELAGDYKWADTALVHLADWTPLEMTVPSKLYEMLEIGIPMTAVVAGESADLVQELHAGRVCEPHNPRALAAVWRAMYESTTLDHDPETGRKWVGEQRQLDSPERLLAVLEEVSGARGERSKSEASNACAWWRKLRGLS